MRLRNSLQRIAISVILTAGITSTALATTIQWSGDNNFNSEAIYFKPFKATELIDIKGSGLYEACCGSNKPTTFSMSLLVHDPKDKPWIWYWLPITLPWGNPGDEKPLSMDSLAGTAPPIQFSQEPLYVASIKLTSKPPDKKHEKDFNFTDFNFVPFLSSYGPKCGKDDDWGKDCDHTEHHSKGGTSFVFCSDADCPANVPVATPLPAALPLMGSVLGGFGIALWRRRRKHKYA